MRVCCAADGDVLDDRSDTAGCDRHASCRHLSVARHYGYKGRLPQLSHSRLSHWLHIAYFINNRYSFQHPVV